jgi:hypothetical protein
MKKILVSAMLFTSVFCFKAQEIKTSHKIYCAPDLKKCLDNLINLKNFLYYDYTVTKEIPEHIYHEYNLVIDYTTVSINMVLTKDEDTVTLFLDETDVNFRK